MKLGRALDVLLARPSRIIALIAIVFFSLGAPWAWQSGAGQTTGADVDGLKLWWQCSSLLAVGLGLLLGHSVRGELGRPSSWMIPNLRGSLLSAVFLFGAIVAAMAALPALAAGEVGVALGVTAGVALIFAAAIAGVRQLDRPIIAFLSATLLLVSVARSDLTLLSIQAWPVATGLLALVTAAFLFWRELQAGTWRNRTALDSVPETRSWTPVKRLIELLPERSGAKRTLRRLFPRQRRQRLWPFGPADDGVGSCLRASWYERYGRPGAHTVQVAGLFVSLAVYSALSQTEYSPTGFVVLIALLTTLNAPEQPLALRVLSRRSRATAVLWGTVVHPALHIVLLAVVLFTAQVTGLAEIVRDESPAARPAAAIMVAGLLLWLPLTQWPNVVTFPVFARRADVANKQAERQMPYMLGGIGLAFPTWIAAFLFNRAWGPLAAAAFVVALAVVVRSVFVSAVKRRFATRDMPALADVH